MSPTAMVLALALALAAPAGAGDDARARKTAEEILRLQDIDASLAQFREQMKTMVSSQVATLDMPDVQKDDLARRMSGIYDMMFEEMTFEKMKEDYIDIYAKTFTAGELDGLLAFYRSPLGRRFLEKAPALMQATMEVGMKRAQALMPRLQTAIEELMQDPEGVKEKQRTTAALLRTIATALESYAVDHGGYPGPTKGFVGLEDVEQDLEPRYLEELPLQDAWGTPLLVLSAKDAYWIVSAGADRTFDRDYRSSTEAGKGMPDSGVTASPDADIIYFNGKFHTWPAVLAP